MTRRTSLALVAAALLLATAVASTSAQRVVAPATSASSSSKSSSKHGCSSIAGCRTCNKSGCTACKTGADLVGGKCNCPAGSGQYGTAGTTNLVPWSNGRRLSQQQQQAANKPAAASGTKPAHGRGKGKNGGNAGNGGGGGSGGASSFACAPCDAGGGYYAPQAKPVGQARCALCPPNTSSDGTTCIVPGGFFYDNTSGTVKSCPANKWCPGGDFQSAGRAVNNCPAGSTSPAESAALDACTVPAGSYYDQNSGKIIKCPVGSYCAGGSVTGDGAGKTNCPEGATTAAIGASTIGQCTVPPGSYFDEAEGTIKKCPVNTYCPGGSVEGGGASPVQCPDGTSFPATGGSALNDCIVTPGNYWDAEAQAVKECLVNKYCEGGPIGTTGKIISNCPASTNSKAGSDAIGDCVVAPGSYYDSVSGTVKQCPAGSWCPGGSVTGAGATKPACPDNTNSAAGSDAEADCTLNAGFYCLYADSVCTVTQCAINQYCPGGVSVTNVDDTGARNCPKGSVSDAGSDGVADCKIPAGSYCATYASGVCNSIDECLANRYCPGGSSVTDTVNNGQKNCPAKTVSEPGSDAKADCTLEAGYYCVYDAIDVCTVTVCAAGSYCPGGASIENPDSPSSFTCPAGTSSPAGSKSPDDCEVAPGYYYDLETKQVLICPPNRYCKGGPISGEGSVTNACDPVGSVSVAGSDANADCKIPAGSYCATYASGVCNSIEMCLANNYCAGGSSVTDTVNNGQKNCPAFTVSDPGSDAKADCTLTAGYYCVYDSNQSCTVTRCPAGSFCPGGSSIEDPKSPGDIECPVGTTSSAGSTSPDNCVVAPGSYYDLDTKQVLICPPNKYCEGGPISGAGSVVIDCPGGSVSAAGSDAIGDCKVPAGSYCFYTDGACTITDCTPNHYCPGGAPLDDPANTGLKACPTSTISAAGSDAKADCTLLPGYFCAFDSNNVCTITPCPVNSYCPGGSSIEDSSKTGKTSCPPNTSSPGGIQSVAVDACVLAPGYTCDFTGVVAGDSCAVTLCAPNSYCSGGNSITDQKPTLPNSIECPTNSKSPAGSDARADCVLDAGYYCVFLLPGICTPTICPTGSYCPGGSSITDAANTGRKQCPSGTTTTATGTTSSSDCITQCGPNQVLLDGACVCNVGFFATTPLPNIYCTSCELATGIKGSSNTKPGATSQASCSTCTYGFQLVTDTTGSTCIAICNDYITNSNSTLPGPTNTDQCDTCAIGYYIEGGNGDNVLDAGETCVACPNGGYGTGNIDTCVSQCNYNEYYDTTTKTCLACPGNRVTDPNAPLGSPTNAGPGVCLCGPGTYISDGNYNNLAGTCVDCSPIITTAGGVYRTVPAYGAVSNANCQFACGPGYSQISATRCFKCQTVDTWSPGGLVDPTGPADCYSCDTTTGYVGAYIDATGDAICNASGVNGNQACVPCNACAPGTLPNSLEPCNAPARRLF